MTRGFFGNGVDERGICGGLIVPGSTPCRPPELICPWHCVGSINLPQSANFHLSPVESPYGLTLSSTMSRIVLFVLTDLDATSYGAVLYI